MIKRYLYPCPCGGKVKWKRERVIKEGIDCGILDIEYCEKCGEEYLPDESMDIVENKLKEAGLWGAKRKEIRFWKTGESITIRLPVEIVRKMDLRNIKSGYIYPEGKHKLTIEV